jgi:hypothetical protein
MLRFCRRLYKIWPVQYYAKYGGQEATYYTFPPDDTSPLGARLEDSCFHFTYFTLATI